MGDRAPVAACSALRARALEGRTRAVLARAAVDNERAMVWQRPHLARLSPLATVNALPPQRAHLMPVAAAGERRAFGSTCPSQNAFVRRGISTTWFFGLT